MVKLKKENQKVLRRLEKAMYFIPTISVFNDRLNSLIDADTSEQEATIKIMSFLTDILKSSQSLVEDIIQGRIASGEIKDASQARKSVAGNNFQRLIAYSVIRNILVGNIPKDVIVNVGHTSKHPILEEYATITVGDSDDSQKPDSDVLIYKDDSTSPIINFSCKTSLRERAGQTYKWKLLVDIANSTCPHIAESESCPKNVYKLQYNNSKKVVMNFVTADLYGEVNQPQISGMFNFFDNSYVTKPDYVVKSNDICSFEHFIDNINNLYV